MAKYLVDLSLDGYENEEEERQAGLEFIEESLDFSGSSVSVKLFDNPYERMQKLHDIIMELEVTLEASISKSLTQLNEVK